MLDGRHTGTGGGNHVTLGGATPADSPLLRRPDLLQEPHHLLAEPSGAVVPVLGDVHRPDQPGAARRRGARRRLYELEIAFQQMDAQARARRGSDAARGSSTGCCATCWPTSPATRTAPSSRSTSSTRRTAPTGRLGLLEFRAFEMPPHARMSLVQMLLLRALVARFWQRAVPRQADRAGAPRCTTAGCCRTSSPRTSATSSRDLQRAGYAFDAELVRRRSSSSAFRATARSPTTASTIELRQAIEPWHVLGEEVSGSRHLALRRLVGRAAAGQGDRHDRRAPRGRPATAARCRSRRPACPASTSPACASARGARRRRCIRRSASTRRSCSTSSTPGRRARSAAAPTTSSHPGGRNYDTFPGQRQRSRGAPRRALLGARPHAGTDDARARAAESALPRDARPALSPEQSGRPAPAAVIGNDRRRRLLL